MRNLGPPTVQELVKMEVDNRDIRVAMTRLRCTSDSMVLSVCSRGFYPSEIMADVANTTRLSQILGTKGSIDYQVVSVLSGAISDEVINHVLDSILEIVPPRCIRTLMRYHSRVDYVHEKTLDVAASELVSLISYLRQTPKGRQRPLERIEAHIRYRFAWHFNSVYCVDHVRLSLHE